MKQEAHHMKTKDLALSYPGFFTAEPVGNTVVLRFSGNFFHNCIDFGKRDFFSDYLEKVGADDDIHAIILHSAYCETGESECLQFFLGENPDRTQGYLGFSGIMGATDLNRYYNFLDQFILDLVRTEKLVIHVCSGNVLTQSMNIALACDYRIVGENTVFHNVFQQVGTFPKGGCIYFMEKILGHSKTLQLLLLQKKISAAQALENGLVDRVVAPEDVEKEALATADAIRKMPMETVAGMKRLANWSLKDLEAFLDAETHEIARAGIKGGREKTE
jgi:enoyl-CoA hydratase/carnithine racemase